MVTIVIANYNGLEHLKTCLPSLARQVYPNYEVLIVDNASNDSSIDYIRSEFSEFSIIQNQTNLGYAAANNIGFEHAHGEYIAVLNQDTRVDPDWLIDLLAVFKEHPGAGLATPKILLLDHPERINTCGNDITMSGLTFCRGLDESKEAFPHLERVSAVSGAAFMIKRAVLDQIGGFDERFFMYYEETDLCLRAMLAGYELYFVPGSIVYHKYSFRYSPSKAFYQERNRYFALLKTLHWGTLLAMLPSLLAAEAIAWGYAIYHGPQHIASKFRTYTWLLRNFSLVLDTRRQVQKLRRVKDRQMLEHFGCRLNFTQTVSPRLARMLNLLVNPCLWVFGSLGRSLVAW